ncbi:probable membrane-associated kinase regulator 1 [Coffea arabica]|uniref:Probable membrane-associated kinase regulator 1 n=1 Tax=Coffea arabica TaxID=13443 RepID=A0A6P6WLD1_COFAR
MGRRTHSHPKSNTLPSSPTHSFSSSSSSDFEFTISLSPRKASSNLCPADELFYKGQLLPLHLSPRISMVRTLLASSSTSSSSDTTTTASRDSTGSSNDSHSSFSSDLILLADCDSSRPSSVAEEDEFRRITNMNSSSFYHGQGNASSSSIKKTKYFSRLSRFSSVFRKESSKARHQESYNPSGPSGSSSSSVKRMSTTAKEVIRKYLKKVKPLYERLSQKQQQQQQKMAGMMGRRMASSSANVTLCMKPDGSVKETDHISYASLLPNGKKEMNSNATIAHSFSGNLRYPRRRSCVSSCPSSMRSSPSHSGILCKTAFTPPMTSKSYSHDNSTMEELQNAIQGAIAHCKNSLLQNKTMVSNEI